ncbi:MAG: hypothetical protein MUP49_06935, partial [Dehalococcoidia bacterium]|nr:hypothetical protein [Dehalococcoidia bacterium]
FILTLETHTPEGEVVCFERGMDVSYPMTQTGDREWQITVDFYYVGGSPGYWYNRNYNVEEDLSALEKAAPR